MKEKNCGIMARPPEGQKDPDAVVVKEIRDPDAAIMKGMRM